ncbi:MAG: isoprenylcysteine carboxylmethyltransferase family protein [Candidatus Omnitrophica bacterium]|nr:isoprenylcysteine carboxylmethyltransferase family protein [Candidatus Omnitrophota bacterium]
MKIRLKINGIIVVIAALVVVFFPGFFFRSYERTIAGNVSEITGLVFILLGQLMRISARGYKAENSTGGLRLINGGLYSVVRNPMYLGIACIGLGVVLMVFKWWVVSIFLLFFIVRYIMLIYEEEKILSARFKKEYSEYTRRVPRIVPSLRSLFLRDVGEYFSLKLSWIYKEIGSVVSLLFLVFFVKSWEIIRAAGIRMYIREMAAPAITVALFVLFIAYLNKRTVKQA